MRSGQFDFEVDCDLCERKELFGEAGVCSENGTECQCPDGYSGRDDWLIYPTCHVNDSLAFGIHAVMLVIVFVGVVASTLCVVILTKKWVFSNETALTGTTGVFDRSGVISPRNLESNQKGDLKSSSKPNSFYNNGTNSRRTLNTWINKKKDRAEEKDWKLKRDTIVANVFFLIFSLASVVYQVPFLRKNESGERVSMRDGNPWHPISFAVALTGILSALYLMLMTWYNTLPDVRNFGNLFKLNPFFVKFPNFIKYISSCMIGFSILYPLVCIAILVNVDEDFYPKMALSFNLVSLFYVGLFGILQWFVISSVMRSFREALKLLNLISAGDNINSRRQSKILKQALSTSWIFRALGTSIMLYCVLLGIIWLSLKQKHQYLILSLVSLGPYLCAVVFPIGILWKTNGGLKPLPLQYGEELSSEQNPEFI